MLRYRILAHNDRMLRYRILAHNDSILRYGYSINVTVSHTAGLGRARGRPLAEEMERETEAPAAVGFGQMIRDLGAVPSHGGCVWTWTVAEISISTTFNGTNEKAALKKMVQALSAGEMAAISDAHDRMRTHRRTEAQERLERDRQCPIMMDFVEQEACIRYTKIAPQEFESVMKVICYIAHQHNEVPKFAGVDTEGMDPENPVTVQLAVRVASVYYGVYIVFQDRAEVDEWIWYFSKWHHCMAKQLVGLFRKVKIGVFGAANGGIEQALGNVELRNDPNAPGDLADAFSRVIPWLTRVVKPRTPGLHYAREVFGNPKRVQQLRTDRKRMVSSPLAPHEKYAIVDAIAALAVLENRFVFSGSRCGFYELEMFEVYDEEDDYTFRG